MSSVLLVDGDNLLTIGFHGLKNHFYKGNHIGGLYHFINTLRRCIEDYRLDKIVVFWDGEDGSSFRRKIYSHYKESRHSRIRSDEELHSYTTQRNRIKQYLEELFIRQGEFQYCETDDNIAYYTRQSEKETKIVYSSDGDLTQLVSEEVKLYNPSHRKLYQPNDLFVYDHEQIKIENIKLCKMLCGDHSDDIAGIKGMGVRTLLTWVPELKTETLTLKQIRDKFNILFEDNRDSKVINNFLTGVSKYGIFGDEFFEINEKIVSLEKPLLTNDAKAAIQSLIYDTMDPEGRSYKNTMKMMMEDGIFLLLPKSDDAWINFLNPFLRLTRKEKNKKIIKIRDYE